MERTIYLQHYRVCLAADGTPRELRRDGAAITYEARDERSGERVDLRLVTLADVEPGGRDKFDEQACAAQMLHHVNVANVYAFGHEGGDFVCVLEHLPGETLAAWVAAHGPMAADAALRVAEQIVSVLASASFHRLPYPPVRPSDIIVVPGQTAEGTWPLVKITNFGLPEVTSGTESRSEVSQPREQASSAEAAQRREHQTTDIDSEIYSLGATLYFLLSGIALSPDAFQRPPKLSKLPKSLRALLARLLHPDPKQRPKDLIVLAEMIRECLLKLERRRVLADKYGIPYTTTMPRRTEARPQRLLRVALPVAAVLLLAAIIAALVFAEPIRRIVHRGSDTKPVGVVIGVRDSSAPSVTQNAFASIAPGTVTSEEGTAALGGAPVNEVTSSSNSPRHPSLDIRQTETSNIQSQIRARNASEANSPVVSPDSSSSGNGETASKSKATGIAQPSTAAQSNSHGKKKSVVSNSKRPRGAQDFNEDSPPSRLGSMRGRVVGISSDGRLILRLPSGRTRFVAPDSEEREFVPRGRRHVFIERDDQTFVPPPPFPRNYFPGD